MAEQLFLFRKAVEFGEQTLRELRGADSKTRNWSRQAVLEIQRHQLRYDMWELGFAYYMKYTRDAYSGDGELKFVWRMNPMFPTGSSGFERSMKPCG